MEPDDVTTIVIPTYNERANVAPLVEQIGAAMHGQPRVGTFEVLFVDDSSDGTPDEVARVAAMTPFPVRCIHRDKPEAGLSGAVIVGLQAARGRACVVMDGDLQHPPAMIPRLAGVLREGDLDIVVASRYTGDGENSGLSSWLRHAVSRGSTLVTKAMFPRRLHGCSDPMTGFFAIDRAILDEGELKPRGFKILLELLVRKQRQITELPFSFGQRHAEESKATFAQGIEFFRQLAALRFGRMSSFALIGAFGALVNIVMVWAMVQAGVGVTLSAIVAAETTIVMNFLLQERYAFADLREDSGSAWKRFGLSFLFNNVESLLRIPFVVWLVNIHVLTATAATAITLAVAFVLRFTFHSLVVYAPRAPSADREPAAQDASSAT